MKYTEYIPREPIKKYIDAYWVQESDSMFQQVSKRFFVYGTTEIVMNMGTSTPYVNAITPLLPGNIYMGGTITRPNEIFSVPNSNFVGIRFKPGGFSIFYNMPVEMLVDQVIEFPDKHLISIIDMDDQLPERLDRFFYAKINER